MEEMIEKMGETNRKNYDGRGGIDEVGGDWRG